MPVDCTPTVIVTVTPDGEPGVFVCDFCSVGEFRRVPSPSGRIFRCVGCDTAYEGREPLGNLLVVHGAALPSQLHDQYAPATNGWGPYDGP